MSKKNSNHALSTPLASDKRKWPVSLCGCNEYRDHQGKSRMYPLFCPQAMICTNMIAGKTCSKVIEEKTCICGLGPQGCLVCLLTIPLGVYHPVAGFGIFCVLSNYLREQTIAKYNVEEEQCCCCGSWNYCINYCHFGCNYPCSLFQVLVSIEHWEAEAKPNVMVVTGTAVPATILNPVQY